MVDMAYEKILLTSEEAALFYQLPKLAHKDPFDSRCVRFDSLESTGVLPGASR
jgi:hypothetical protein